MLPRGYTRVEYIESTGTQYIDTGVKASNDLSVKLVFQCSSNAITEHAIFGASWSIDGFFLLAFQSKLFRWHASGVATDISNIDMTAVHTVFCSNDEFAIDNQKISIVPTGQNEDYPIRLFSVYNNPQNYGNAGKYKLFGYEMATKSAVIRDYVPFVSASNEAGLWDNIEGLPAEKSGTFLYGAAVIPPPVTEIKRIPSAFGNAFEWTRSEYANEYVIERDGHVIDSVYGDVLSYVDVGTTNTHTYTVTPLNGTQPGDPTSITIMGIPDAPSNIDANVTIDGVTVTWDGVPGADEYVVYRDNAVIAVTTDTKYTDTLKTPFAVRYAVSSCIEGSASAPSDSIRAESWGEYAPKLITNRTLADVNDAKSLIAKYMRGEIMSESEKATWDAGLRGCYTASDTNRVEYHTRELQNILNENGYTINIDTKLWAKSDIMRYSDVVRYLGNIETILNSFGRSANAPPLPTIDEWIDYVAANNIEMILHLTRELIAGALAMFRRLGAFNAGNNYEAQVIRRA